MLYSLISIRRNSGPKCKDDITFIKIILYRRPYKQYRSQYSASGIHILFILMCPVLSFYTIFRVWSLCSVYTVILHTLIQRLRHLYFLSLCLQSPHVHILLITYTVLVLKKTIPQVIKAPGSCPPATKTIKTHVLQIRSWALWPNG